MTNQFNSDPELRAAATSLDVSCEPLAGAVTVAEVAEINGVLLWGNMSPAVDVLDSSEVQHG